ncbi:TPA: translocation protein TolB precursor, partial [Neisseria meningitidis]
ENRITTVTVMRDDEKIELIKERVTACQDYYETLLSQYR